MSVIFDDISNSLKPLRDFLDSLEKSEEKRTGITPPRFEVPSLRSIYDSVIGSLANSTPETIKEIAVNSLFINIAVGASASFIPTVNSFFSYGIGQIYAEILRPLVSAVVVRPEEEILKKTFRYGAPNARILIAMMQDGTIDVDMLRQALIVDNVKDEFISPLIDYAIGKRDGARLKLKQQVEGQVNVLQTLYPSLWVSRAEAGLARLEREIESSEIKVSLIEMEREINKIERLAAQLESAANNLEVATTTSTEKKAFNSVHSIMRRSRDIK